VYMLGHSKIGDAVRRAGLFGATNIPFMLQNVGTMITMSMTTHMMAAFPSANFHFFCDAETWKEDVVEEKADVINGFVRVSEEPGLGITLDREKLQQLENLTLPKQKKWIINSSFKNGTKMYNIADTDESIFMVRPSKRRYIPFSYDSLISTEYWDDDGSATYKQMFERIEREGIVLEQS